MSNFKDLRYWREMGLGLRRERELRGLSIRSCAEQINARPEDLLSIESGNVYAFYRKESKFLSILSEYRGLLGDGCETELADAVPQGKYERIAELSDMLVVPAYLKAG